MKSRRILCLLALALTFLFHSAVNAQEVAKTYQQMSPGERQVFVAEQARRIAREMSGIDYKFTPEFSVAIQGFVDSYTRRIGKGETQAILLRGQAYAPTLIAVFKARAVSPIIGLYLPLIESEYVNLENPNAMGAVGMFQFLPQTGRLYDLTPEELLDVEKAADAAARYISDSLRRFKSDQMKEALALLAYNRGGPKVTADLSLVLTPQNENCSICALTAASSRLDRTFQSESVHYVPAFFAAAIVGENPGSFGLQTQPLSSLGAQ